MGSSPSLSCEHNTQVIPCFFVAFAVLLLHDCYARARSEACLGLHTVRTTFSECSWTRCASICERIRAAGLLLHICKKVDWTLLFAPRIKKVFFRGVSPGNTITRPTFEGINLWAQNVLSRTTNSMRTMHWIGWKLKLNALQLFSERSKSSYKLIALICIWACTEVELVDRVGEIEFHWPWLKSNYWKRKCS